VKNGRPHLLQNDDGNSRDGQAGNDSNDGGYDEPLLEIAGIDGSKVLMDQWGVFT
jgi:hypothetical protein